MMAILVCGCSDHHADDTDGRVDSATSAELQECADRDSHAGMSECLQRLADKTDAELLRSESMLKARISAWDSRDASHSPYVRESLAWLARDIEDYRRYRESHCELDASRAAGGNGMSDMRLSCRVLLDRARERAVREWLESFEP